MSIEQTDIDQLLGTIRGNSPLPLEAFGLMRDQTNGQLQKAKEFADRTGQAEQLKEVLERLRTIAKNSNSVCTLYPDFAPYSFGFDIPGCFNGGLIYHGKHDNGGDGSAPTFSVCLTETHGWSIHT